MPITAPVSRQATSEGSQCTSFRVITMPITAAAVPPVNPADRSISPSSNTNTRPIASTVIAADWLIRLAKLKAFVNVPGRSAENTDTRTSRPRTAGSAPTSPPRTLVK